MKKTKRPKKKLRSGRKSNSDGASEKLLTKAARAAGSALGVAASAAGKLLRRTNAGSESPPQGDTVRGIEPTGSHPRTTAKKTKRLASHKRKLRRSRGNR